LHHNSTSASTVARITDVCYHTWLISEIGLTVLLGLVSNYNRPISPTSVAGIIAVCHCTWPHLWISTFDQRPR
jgi:hypothetical protein